MRIYVGYESAFRFWQKHYPSEYSSGNQGFLHSSTLVDCARTAEEIAPLRLSKYDFGLSKPTICVPAASYRCLPEAFSYHVCGMPFPKKSFVCVSRNVYVATPELCFLQLAKTRSLVDLLALGFELCGTYPAEPLFENNYESNHGPVTTKRKLTSFIDKAAHHLGVKPARRCANWLLDGSASPMETVMAILLTTPASFGGYAFKQPVLNGEVSLSPAVRETTGKRSYRCDMLYPNEHVGVEYNSKEWHTGMQRIAEDAFRSNALSYLGIRLITVTPRELFDPDRFDTIAREIAKGCGWRFRKSTPQQFTKKLALREELLRPGGVIMA